ncbi:hypothetical protein XELAEV_18011241mg [Xenopus laevis]|uniref:Uncharacterized protein n=1 Tax=Xenopus laevis TaxID=8355 RepID=A0A974DLI0_XENLA|nr:hypothetical protein XELAEV_18011241mg [Xenopus laevis]
MYVRLCIYVYTWSINPVPPKLCGVSWEYHSVLISVSILQIEELFYDNLMPATCFSKKLGCGACCPLCCTSYFFPGLCCRLGSEESGCWSFAPFLPG